MSMVDQALPGPLTDLTSTMSPKASSVVCTAVCVIALIARLCLGSMIFLSSVVHVCGFRAPV